MKLFYKVFLVSLVTACWAYVPTNDPSDAGIRKSPSDLKKDLFKNYDKTVRPVKDYTTSITTDVGLAPLFIREVDEEKEILVMDTWIVMKWHDDYLTWNPDDYGGMKTLNVPSSEVWKPDITTYTASPDVTLLPKELTNVIVYPTGVIMWVPPVTISSRCPLDLTDYPYDIQRCLIKVGSWTFGKSAVDLQMYTTSIDIKDFADNNPDWSMIGAIAQRFDNFYPCCPNESYPSINYNLTLKRKQTTPTQIGQNISCYAGFLALLMFWMPPDSVYKVALGGLAELMLALTVLFVGIVVPAPAARLKAAARIYPVMCAVAGALLIEVLIMNLARVMGSCRPPQCLLKIAKGFCNMFCVCNSRSSQDGELQIETDQADKMKKRSLSAQVEWNLIAKALDRILFLIALIVSVIFFKLW